MSDTWDSLEHRATILKVSEPRPGSALTPLAQEAAWVAYRIVAADPAASTAADRAALAGELRQLTWQAWIPGRVALISEVATRPDHTAPDHVDVECTFALGCFGPVGSTAADLAGFDAGLHNLFDRLAPVFTVRRVDASRLVGYPAVNEVMDTTLLRPRRTGYTIGSRTVDSYGWLDLRPFPWQHVLQLASGIDAAVRIRATILATEPSPADRHEIDRIIEQVDDAQLTSGHARAEPYGGFEREITHLYRMTSPPVFVSEVAIGANRPLDEPEVRGIVSSLIRHDEVPRSADQHEPWPIASGGVQIIRNPTGHLHALATGIPLCGGVTDRTVADLVAPGDVPIGLPWPVGSRLPGIPARVEPVAAQLRPSIDPTSFPAHIGTAGGSAISLPDAHRNGNVTIVGAAGTGKSTVLANLIRHDLVHFRHFFVVDADGDLTRAVQETARTHGRNIIVIDPFARSSRHLSFAARLSPAGGNRPRVEHTAAVSADAVSHLVDERIGRDPRFRNLCFAVFELQAVTDVDVADLVTLLTDPTALRRSMSDLDLSARSRRQLDAVAHASADTTDSVGVLCALLEQTNEGLRRPILGRPTKALSFDQVACHEQAVLLDVHGLSEVGRSLVANLAIAHLVDALKRRDRWFLPFRIYVDGVDHLGHVSLIDLFGSSRRANFGASVTATDVTALRGRDAAALWSAETRLLLHPVSTGPEYSTAATTAATGRPDPDTLGLHQAQLSIAPHRIATVVDLDPRHEVGPAPTVAQEAARMEANEVDEAATVAMIRRFFPGAVLTEPTDTP